MISYLFFFNDTATTEIYTLSLHDALPISYGNAIETRRRDADHLEGIAIQGEAFSNHRRIAGKVSLPEGVTDVCSRDAATRLVIRRTKQSPKNRLDAKDVKEIAADADAFCFADLPARGQIEPLVGPNGNFGEAFLALADLLPHGKGELGILAGELAGAPVAVCEFHRSPIPRGLGGEWGQRNRKRAGWGRG